MWLTFFLHAYELYEHSKKSNIDKMLINMLI